MKFAEIENKIALRTVRQYGQVLVHAESTLALLHEFVAEIHETRRFFGAYLGQVINFSRLAVVSLLRLHFAQAGWCVRYAIEACAKAAYCIGNEDVDREVLAYNDKGIPHENEGFSRTCYVWLKERYPKKSAKLKDAKDAVNEVFAHANINTAMSNVARHQDTLVIEPFDRLPAGRLELMLYLATYPVLVMMRILAFEINRSEDAALISSFEGRFADCVQKSRRLNLQVENITEELGLSLD